MRYYMIDFNSYGDSRGLLTVFQKKSNIPFDLKRIFYSNQIPNDARRGCHANRNSEFVLVSVAGSCEVFVDDGKNRETFVLDSPQKGLYCGKMTWKEMFNFSPDNVLLVLASTEYDANEYIKDYEQFKQEVAQGTGNAPKIHPLADVLSKNIGENTNIWQYCVVLPDAKIGKNCNICSNCFIENDVKIGDNVTVKNGVSIYDGITIEDNVFIGPNASFCNDKYPRSKQYPEAFLKTTIKKGASIGSNATILPGVTIGENAMVAAGAVVVVDVPANTLYFAKDKIKTRFAHGTNGAVLSEIVVGGDAEVVTDMAANAL